MGKQNDFMTNMLANPNFTISDFRAVGFNADNTSLESESTYANSERIRNNPMFQKADGSFDAAKFHNVYVGAQAQLNNLCDETFHEDLIKQTSFHRDNIFAPVELRRQGPDFGFIKMPNPDRESSSMFRLGQWSENSKTRSELALMEKVLANPSEAYDANGNLDPSKAIWHDSPNDSWLTDFWDTRVFALWDEDGEHIDPITGMKVKHAKGDAKLNQDGHYFYENLDGRDVYGRQVLNKMDYLTSDDSKWNKYDFFDSDGKDKSVFGTVMKNLALVGSMYIPYVGPAIAGLSVLTQAAGLFGTLGKMAVGSDSPHLSALEGWAKSMSRDNKSEYAQNNTWCWENFIGLVGDVMAQFKEQRFLFEKAPALFKGTLGASKSNLAAYELALKLKYNDLTLTKILGLKEEGAAPEKIMRALKELSAISRLKVQADMESYIKGYNKMGEIMSKAYMTGVTVADTYGEAKMQGASDTEATLLTLGYGAAEAALLNTGLGEWLFPELRYNKMHQEAIAKALLDALGATKQLEEKLVKESLKRGVKEAKKDYAKRVFNYGYNAAKSLWTASESVGAKTIKNTFANASGEAFEEVSEELLADLSKGCFNVVNWLRGDDTKLEAFDTDWKNPNSKTNWGAMFDRYAMNFMGGFVGGGISGMSLDNIKAMANLDHMDFNQGMQLLIYMVRNGEANDFLKLVNKMTLGDKNLSGTRAVEQTEDGQIIWELALDKNDTLDALAKRAINNQVLLIQGILSGNNIDISDDSFLKGLTTVNEDIRYAYLANSKTAGRYLQEFNTLSARIIDATVKLNGWGEGKTDSLQRALNNQENQENNQLNNLQNNQLGNLKPKKKTEAEKEEDAAETSVNKLLETSKAIREAAKLRLKELLKEKLSLFEGEKKATFIRDALFEMTPAISDPLVKVSFILFAEAKSGKKFNRIDDDEKSRLSELYKSYLETDLPENIHIASEAYYNMMLVVSDVLRQLVEAYTLSANNELVLTVNNFYKGGFGGLAETILKGSEESEPTAYVELALNALNRHNIILGGFINNLFTTNNLETLRVQLANLHEDATNRYNAAVASGDAATAEAAMVEIKGIEKQLNDLVVNSIAENAEQLVDPYIRLGFINSEVKARLKEVILNSIKNISTRLTTLIEEALELEASRDPNDLARAVELRELFSTLRDKKVELQSRFNTLDGLLHSPILKSLEEFTLSTTGEGLNITELLAKVDNSLMDKRDNLEDFTYGKDLGDQIEEALRAIELYRIAIEGAKVDNGDADNMFGYNRTINNVNQALGVEAEELAEIDTETANAFLLDLFTLRNKLTYAKNLNAINSGQKLAKLSRVSGRTSELLFKKLKTRLITAIPDDWKGKDVLKNSLNELTLLNDIDAGNVNSRSLTADKKELLLKETLLMEDALYEFAQANLDKLTDSNAVALLLKEMEFLGNNRALLNESTELKEFDDGAFTWWLATRMAVKASSFYNRFAKIINTDPSNPRPIAPITPQELAIYTNYASIVNGKVFDTFFDAYKKRIDDNWASLTQNARKDVYESIYGEDATEAKTLDKYTSNANAHLARVVLGNSLRYSNIVFTEGIPGAGKSTGVYLTTIKLLLEFHKDDGLLDNVIYVHGANKESGQKAMEELGLDPSKAMSREEFMKYIVEDWVDPTTLSDTEVGKRMHANADGTYTSANKLISMQDKDAPTLILLDEATNFTLLDFDDMDKFAKEHGITILAAGDTDQSGVKLDYTVTETPLGTYSDNLDIFSSNFIHSFKLGVSMRTANSLKSLNLVTIQAYILNPELAEGVLKYCINENGLFGDRLIDIEYQGDRDSGFHVGEEELEEGSDLGDSIRLMLDTLKEGEKIGYIYDDEESALYKMLTSDLYKDKINAYKGTSALGREGLYFIIEMDESRHNYNKDLYTAITRAEQGSIIIRNINSTFFNKNLRDVSEIETINEGLTSKSIIPFATLRKKFLEENTEAGEVKYEKRKSLTSRATPTTTTNTNLGNVPEAPSDPPPTRSTSSTTSSVESATEPSSSKALTKAQLDTLIAPLGLHTGDAIKFSDGTIGTFKDVTSTASGLVIFNYQDENGHDQSKSWEEIMDPDTGTFNVSKYTPSTPPLLPEPFVGETIPDDVFSFPTGGGGHGNSTDYYADWKFKAFLPSIEWLNKHLEYPVESGLLAEGFAVENGKAFLMTIKPEGGEYIYVPIKTSLEEATNDNLEDPYKTPVTEYNPEEVIPDTEISAFDDNQESPDIAADAEELQRLTDLSILLQPESAVVVHKAAPNKRKPIDILVHSFNTFETGVANTDETKPPVLTADEATNAKRIDSVNGLLNIDKKLGRQPRTLGEYVLMLGELRSILLDYSDINELNAKLTDFMGRNFGISEVNTIFGFKSTYPGGEISGDDFDVFYKSELETYHYIGGETEPLLKHLKLIIATIGNEELGDVLELPILIFSNPMTVIRSKIGDTYQFPELLQIWDSIDKSLDFNVRVNHFINALSEAQKVEYGTLVDLFRVYADETGKNYYKITKRGNLDWTPAKAFECLGPLLVGEEKGTLIESDSEGVYESDEFYRLPKYIAIATLAKNPLIRDISPLLFSNNKLGTIIGPDGSPISVNGKTQLLLPGHPFILYSMSDSVTDMWKLYVYLLMNPNAPRKVGLAYVLPPSVDVETYIDTLADLLNKKTVNDIGNSVTAFKILLNAFWDPDFVNNILILNGDSAEYIEAIQEVLQDIANSYKNLPKDLQAIALVNFLKLPLHNSKLHAKGASYRSVLRRILAELGYRSARSATIAHRGERNAHNIELLKTVSAKSGLDKIYFHAKAATQGTDYIPNGLAYELELEYDDDGNPLWAIKDANGNLCSYTMHAKIDSLIFRGDPSLILSMILKDRAWKAEHSIERSALLAYVHHTLTGKGSVNKGLNPSLKKLKIISDKLNTLGISTGLTDLDIQGLSDLNIHSMFIKFTNILNLSGIPAVLVGDEIVFTDTHDLTFDNKNLIIQDYQDTDPFAEHNVIRSRDAEGKIYFTMRVEDTGDIYDVIVDDKHFEFTKKGSPTFTYAVNESNFGTVWNAILPHTEELSDLLMDTPLATATDLNSLIDIMRKGIEDYETIEMVLEALELDPMVSLALLELKRQVTDENNMGKDNCDLPSFKIRIA